MISSVGVWIPGTQSGRGSPRNREALPGLQRVGVSASAETPGPTVRDPAARRLLATNGVNTNGAAAKVMNFDRLGEKVRPGTFGNIKVG